MIFNLIIIIAVLLEVLFPLPQMNSNASHSWNNEDTSQEQEITIEPVHIDLDEGNYEESKKNKGPEITNFTLDLDNNGRNERVVVASYPGFPGDQNTEIYINPDNLELQPALTEVGAFYSIQTHNMDSSKENIVELQLQTGQSFNTLFYTYRNGKLERVPVSTEKPPSWHGIISRNAPEFKDIDGDGTLELFAYYHFLYDTTRRVEVYAFDGTAFIKTGEYEENVPSSREDQQIISTGS